MTSPAHRLLGTVGALVLVCTTLLGHLAAATAAPHHGHDRKAAQHGLAGKPVSGSEDPQQAQPLPTGRYVVQLPRHDSTYFRLARSAPATTFHVGVLFVGDGDSIGEGVEVRVGTEPGASDCGNTQPFRPTTGEDDPLLFGSISTWTDVTEHPCADRDTLYVTVRPPTDRADAGRPIELAVYEEPPLTDAELSALNTATPPTWAPPTSGEPRAVAAAGTPDRAPVVEPGSYRLDLMPGQTQVVAVPLDWGQNITAEVDGDPPGGMNAEDAGVVMHLLGPVLDEVDTGAPVTTDQAPRTSGDDGTLLAAAQSQPVAYRNRDSVDTRVNGATLAGVHYVTVTYLPDHGSQPLAATLTLQLDGMAGVGIPAYTPVEGLYPPVADSRLVDGSLPTLSDADPVADGDQQTISADHPLPWRWILIGLGVLLVLWGVVRWLLDRRRARQTDRYHARHRGPRHQH